MLDMNSSINQVILRDSARNCWLRFDKPQEIVEAHRYEDVLKSLRYMEESVSRMGLHAAGMIAYEAAPGFDPSLVVRNDGKFPLLWFGLYDQPCEMDISREAAETAQPGMDWLSSVTPEEYCRAFERIKNYIRDGDTYQVNYSYRLRGSFSSDAWSFFIRLIAAQGPTLGAFIKTRDWIICSASPELFFRLDGALIESRPMKGTAARGLTFDQDRNQAAMLQASVKNRAENLMIVDMVRNDMGRIAQTGSVNVADLFALEKYPTLWQMTSTVRAETSASLTDIFKAMFPPASITGAPKNRTMQIIAELETTPRRIYTGSIGFIAPDRRAQFNVAIRTLLINRESGQAEYGVGGGIVWDSDCDMEQAECRIKARILKKPVDRFSLLETILWTHEGGFLLLEKHLKRLEQSAAYFDYPIDMEHIRQHLMCLSQDLPQSPHKIRLLVSSDGRLTCQAEVLALPMDSSPKRVALARFPVDKSNPFLYHKTTNRRVYEEALSACPGYDDVILYNQDGEVTESTIANVVVDVNGAQVTPPVRCGLLPGTYREWMIEMNLIEEKPITIDQLLESRCVFLINSVRGMYKVRVESNNHFSFPEKEGEYEITGKNPGCVES
jgi:para-aminobenzoate synthetase/4-amino-4-deoxychorismate lyase